MKIDRTGLGPANNNISAYKLNEQQRENDQAPVEKTNGKNKSDSVQISDKAKKLFEAQNAEKSTRGEDPLKKALLNSNVANSPEQADRISGKVDEKMAVKDADKEKQLELVKKRLNENYYNSPEVISKIADGLMKDLNIT